MQRWVFFYRLTLGQKLAVTFSVGVLAVAALVGLVTIRNTERLMDMELKKQGTIIVSHLSHRSLPFALAGEVWPLYKAVKDTVKPTEKENPASGIVTYAMVLNDKMEILAHSQPAKFRVGDVLQASPLNDAASKAEGLLIQPTVSASGEWIYDVAKPIMYEGHKLGIVRIGVTQRFMKKSVATIRNEILFTTFLLACIGALLGLAVSRRITKPLRQLSVVAHGIAKGQFVGNMTIAIKEKDEVGILADTFNRMTNALREKVGELRNTKDYLQSLLEAANDFIYTLDREGRFTYINAKFADWGYSKEELIGQPFISILSEKHKGPRTQELLREGCSHQHEIEIKDKLGNMRTVLLSVTPLPGGEQEPAGLLGIAKDITLLKEMERHLFDSEKLASMGALMISLGHEISNPLGIIHGFTQELEELLSESSKSSNGTAHHVFETAIIQIKIIEEEVFRCQRVVGNLLEFARPSPPKRELTLISELLERSLKLISPLAKKKGVRCRLHIEGDVPPVLLDTHQLQQVLVNVCLNALDAMPHGGELRLEGSLQSEDATPIDNGKSRFSARHVMMVISDTGQGIAEEDISHIFQAFFSKRKTDKKGTGLGLFLSKQIVESHGGKIEVESTLGKGATFRIRVPVVEVPEAELMRSAFNAENSHC